MKRKSKLWNRIIKTAELPQDLDPHLFFVQWFGSGECLIEQHRGVLSFEPCRIRFLTEQGTVELTGEELVCEQLTETRAKVRGAIKGVTLEGKS